MNVFELMASLGVDLSKYKAGIAEAKEEFVRLGDEIQKVSKQIGDKITSNANQAANNVKKITGDVEKKASDTSQKIGDEAKKAGNKVKKESEEASEGASKAYEKMGCQGYVNIVYYDYFVKVENTYRFFFKAVCQ